MNLFYHAHRENTLELKARRLVFQDAGGEKAPYLGPKDMSQLKENNVEAQATIYSKEVKSFMDGDGVAKLESMATEYVDDIVTKLTEEVDRDLAAKIATPDAAVILKQQINELGQTAKNKLLKAIKAEAERIAKERVKALEETSDRLQNLANEALKQQEDLAAVPTLDDGKAAVWLKDRVKDVNATIVAKLETTETMRKAVKDAIHRYDSFLSEQFTEQGDQNGIDDLERPGGVFYDVLGDDNPFNSQIRYETMTINGRPVRVVLPYFSEDTLIAAGQGMASAVFAHFEKESQRGEIDDFIRFARQFQMDETRVSDDNNITSPEMRKLICEWVSKKNTDNRMTEEQSEDAFQMTQLKLGEAFPKLNLAQDLDFARISGIIFAYTGPIAMKVFAGNQQYMDAYSDYVFQTVKKLADGNTNVEELQTHILPPVKYKIFLANLYAEDNKSDIEKGNTEYIVELTKDIESLEARIALANKSLEEGNKIEIKLLEHLKEELQDVEDSPDNAITDDVDIKKRVALQTSELNELRVRTEEEFAQSLDKALNKMRAAKLEDLYKIDGFKAYVDALRTGDNQSVGTGSPDSTPISHVDQNVNRELALLEADSALAGNVALVPIEIERINGYFENLKSFFDIVIDDPKALARIETFKTNEEKEAKAKKSVAKKKTANPGAPAASTEARTPAAPKPEPAYRLRTPDSALQKAVIRSSDASDAKKPDTPPVRTAAAEEQAPPKVENPPGESDLAQLGEDLKGKANDIVAQGIGNSDIATNKDAQEAVAEATDLVVNLLGARKDQAIEDADGNTLLKINASQEVAFSGQLENVQQELQKRYDDGKLAKEIVISELDSELLDDRNDQGDPSSMAA